MVINVGLVCGIAVMLWTYGRRSSLSADAKSTVMVLAGLPVGHGKDSENALVPWAVQSQNVVLVGMFTPSTVRTR